MTDQMIKRHVGRMANTDQRVVVVYMQIPGKEDHTLVVAVDALPPRFEQSIMAVLDSAEGQSTLNLGEVLGRRLMPDSNKSLFQVLHESNLLQAVPVDNVVMYPMPNRPFPLRQLLEQMGRVVAPSDEIAAQEAALLAEGYGGQAELNTPAPAPAPTQAEVQKFNPHLHNQAADAKAENLGIAQTLLLEATDLEAIAKQKREQAYQYAPSLRPAAPAPKARVAPAAPAVEAPAKAAPKRASRAKKAQG